MPRRTIVVTGGSGFIGTNFINYWHRQYPDDRVVNIDRQSYAANPKKAIAGAIEGVSESWYQERAWDLGLIPSRRLADYFKELQPSGVFHLAAESHVDRSIEAPEIFARSNVTGTLTVLEALRALEHPCRMVMVSTDEVFGDLKSLDDLPFDESSPYRPSSPYAASKAAAEQFCMAYRRTFGLDIVTTNCVNNYGPWQNDEKFIPTVIKNAILGYPIPIYGTGQNSREWIHVDDHCEALETVFNSGMPGARYCIGSGDEITNIELASEICLLVDDYLGTQNSFSRITYVPDRKGHDFRYSVSSTELHCLRMFRPKVIDSGLPDVVNWYGKLYGIRPRPDYDPGVEIHEQSR